MNSLFVTYEDISDCWPTFKHNIEGFFPLRNVHKPKLLGANENNTLIRNIPIINLKFIPLKAESLALKSIMNIYERPYLNIFIGYCEDIDIYRQQFRPKLKTWLESISIRKNHQYMVILIENQSMVNDSNKSGKTFLLDKIRFDFSDKVTLKLISLKLLPGENLNFIPECIDLISDCVYQSAIMNLNQLDEDIRTLASQKNTAEWNFFTFFLTKESKALILTDLGLLSEAIACYDELEALYLEIDTSISPVPFKSMLPSDLTINGSDLSPSNCAKYRELINQNQISRYDFQTYLLSKQIHLLRDLKDYVQILKRCKEYVCKNITMDALNGIKKEKWIVETILHVLKIIDIDSVQVQPDFELSNLLADVLFMASSQIKPDYAIDTESSSIEQLLDLAQIMEYPNTVETENNILLKVSAMRYCLSILKGPNYIHKHAMILLKLADAYYELKLFNIALEILQEASEKTQGLNWSAIQLLLIRKVSDCFWNLNMSREYLQGIFEMIQIPGYGQFLEITTNENVEKAINSLDDKLSFTFEKFFNVGNVIIKQTSQDSIELHVELNSYYVLPVERCDLLITLFGEKQDIVFSALNAKIQGNNIIVAHLSANEERPSGNHRLKSINLNFGDLHFESDIVTNIWNQDIHLMATDGFFIEASVPKNFDFGDPRISILCRNNNNYDAEHLSLIVNSNILDLTTCLDPDSKICRLENDDKNAIIVEKLLTESEFEIDYSITNYNHGRHFIKVISTFNYNGGLKKNLVSTINIDLPDWNINQSSIKSSVLNLERMEILSSRSLESPSKKLTLLGIDCQRSVDDFNFEIDPSVGGVNIVCSTEYKKDEFKLVYSLENDRVIRSVSFPSSSHETESLYCTVIPNNITCEETKIGSFIKFEVRLEGNVTLENIPFSILYDPNHWLLSGSSNGFSKASWYFDMAPIRKGLIQLPSVKFSTSIPVHIFSDGMGVFVNSL